MTPLLVHRDRPELIFEVLLYDSEHHVAVLRGREVAVVSPLFPEMVKRTYNLIRVGDDDPRLTKLKEVSDAEFAKLRSGFEARVQDCQSAG